MDGKVAEIKSGKFKIEISSDKLQVKNFFGKTVGMIFRSGFLTGRRSGEAGDIVYKLETMPWYTDSIGEDILEAMEDYWGIK